MRTKNRGSIIMMLLVLGLAAGPANAHAWDPFSWVSNTVSSVASSVGNLVSTVVSGAGTVVSTVVSGAGTVVNGAVNVVGTVASTVVSGVGGVVNTVIPGSGQVFNGVASAITTATSTIQAVTTTVTSTVSSAAGSVASPVVPVVKSVASALASTVNATLSVVSGKSTVSALTTSVMSSTSNIIQSVSSLVAQTSSIVASTVTAGMKVVGQIVDGAASSGKSVVAGVANFVHPSGTLGAIVSTPFDLATQLSKYVQLASSVLYNIAQNAIQIFLDLDYFGAEPGNYNLLVTAMNFFNPQLVDRPVTAADQTLPYPVPVTYGQVDRKAYFKWQKVQLPQTTGAKCANGSDYKFFVNLTPASNNFLIFMEPGGGCYDYGSCTGKLPKKNPDGSYMFDKNGMIQEGSQRSIVNPDGISDNYIDTWPVSLASTLSGGSSGGLESPLLSRLSGASPTRFKMQGWNIIYMPYCTGDTHVGDMVRLLTRVDGKASKLVYFKGTNNVMATMGWLRSNLPQPAQVFLTGMSAGSLAVDATRAIVRKVISPWDSLYTMADSGFVLAEDPVNHDLNRYPATDAVARIRKVWWDYDPANPSKKTPISLIKAIVPGINPDNLTTFGLAINRQFPQDRMSYVASQSDQDFSGYAYLENTGFRQAALADGDINRVVPTSFFSNLAKFVRKNWLTDLGNLQNSVSQMNANTGYYMPSGRLFNESHCMLALTYEGVYNADTGHTIVDAINNLVDRSRPPVLRERESDPTRGLFLPLGPFSQGIRAVMPEKFLGVN